MPHRTGSSSGAYLRAQAFMACSTASACFRSESLFVYWWRMASASSRLFVTRRVYLRPPESVRITTGEHGPLIIATLVPRGFPLSRVGRKPHKFNVFCHREETVKQGYLMVLQWLFTLVCIVQQKEAR